LGLTGGGGAIFAVPLLVYGLGQPAREAVGVSLAAVGATALVGFALRLRSAEVEPRAGLILAAAGAPGAGLGTWLAGLLPEAQLLAFFGALMIAVAISLWRHANPNGAPCGTEAAGARMSSAGCGRATGQLTLNARCAMLLLGVGMATGVLSGLFGVGGGFVIVPALVLATGLPIHRAVGTSLLVIALVSAAGVASRIIGGQAIDLRITAQFVVGGIAGLVAGQQAARKLSGPALQRGFAVAIVGVAAFVLWRGAGS
jgi:hypothetical protein